MKAWKVRREARRIAQHLQGVLIAPYETVVRAYRKRPAGRLQLKAFSLRRRKLAVYVVYQPGGLPESIFSTVRYLERSGYQIVVVSNCTLSLSDRLRLESVECDVVERPNFGYDFGAYQDALGLLWQHLAELDALLLMNDSVWVPFLNGGDPLQVMESCPIDVMAAQVFGERLLRQRSGARRHPILGSYFMHFRSRALSHDSFRRFWLDYRMSSNKEITLRRGERELSRCLYESGLSCGALLDQASFEETVKHLSEERLRQAVEELVCLSAETAIMRTELLMSGTDRVPEMRQLLFDVSETKNMLGSSSLLCLEHLSSAVFVKKNNEMLYRLARQRIAKALGQGRLRDVDPVMAIELLQRAEADSCSPDLREAELA